MLIPLQVNHMFCHFLLRVVLFRERDHTAEAINGVYSPILFSALPDQIRFLQRSQTHFVPRLRHTDDVDGLRRRLKRHGTFDADDLAAAEDPTASAAFSEAVANRNTVG